MESIANILTERYGLELTPTYFAMRCSNRKTFGEECRACVDVCPQGIYPPGKRKKPDWTHCLGCGLCTAVCPDRCLMPPKKQASQFLMALVKRGALSVSCRKDSGARLLLPCLAALSWEQIALAAMEKEVWLDCSACEGCERGVCTDHLQKALDSVRRLLGRELCDARIHIVYDPAQLPQAEGMDRRELLRFWGNLPLDHALAVLPELPTEQDSGLLYRAMLRDKSVMIYQETPPEQRPRYRVTLPSFGDNCFDCGLCNCPQKALSFLPGEDSFTVAVDVWKCTGCGICMRACRDEGILKMTEMLVPHLSTVALRHVKRYSCRQCGAHRPKNAADELCRACRVKWEAQEKDRLRRERQQKKES